MNDNLSNIFEKLNINKDSISPEMIDNIMGMLGNNSNNSDDSNHSSNDSNSNDGNENAFPDIDIETLLKIKSIMEQMNKRGKSPRTKLLNDLKPFLNESKQNKVDQYIKMDKIVELLPLIGGGEINTRLYNDDQALLFSLIALLF